MATPTFAPSFRLIKCPPAAAHGILPPEPAFGNRGRNPVSVEFHANGEVTSTGFSFEEYQFAQTRVRKSIGHQRRLATPSWAFNVQERRELITRFWELRADIKKPREGSLEERLRYADKSITEKQRPHLYETMKRLVHERMVTDDPKRRHILEIEIRNIDTRLRIMGQGPALIAGIIYWYFCAGLDSVGVGAELGIHPNSVRQLTNRLRSVWKKMQDGTDGKVIPRRVERRQEGMPVVPLAR